MARLTAFGSVLGLAAASGGYFPQSWGWAALALAWVAALALLVGSPQRPSRLELAFLGGLLAFAAWSGLSAVWSQSVPATVLEVERDAVYLAGLAAALVLARRGLEDGVLAAAVVVCAWNLVWRIHGYDASVPGADAEPIGYANGLGLLAAIALVFSSFAWAAGSLYATRAARPADPLVGVAMQMLTGGVVLCAAGVGQWSSVDLGGVSARSAGGLAYLIVIGSIVGYSAYGWLLHNAPTSLVSTYAYVNPVVAVLLGALFLSEPVTEHTLVGGAVIVVAVALIISARPKRRDAPVAAEGALDALEEAA